MPLLYYLVNTCLLRTYYVLGIVQGTRDTWWAKAGKELKNLTLRMNYTWGGNFCSLHLALYSC